MCYEYQESALHAITNLTACEWLSVCLIVLPNRFSKALTYLTALHLERLGLNDMGRTTWKQGLIRHGCLQRRLDARTFKFIGHHMKMQIALASTLDTQFLRPLRIISHHDGLCMMGGMLQPI